MLHGWDELPWVFAPAVPEISKKARVVTYDHRGHSGSKDANREMVTLDTLASDLNELIHGLGLSEILLGWSMGGATMMNYAEALRLQKASLSDSVRYNPEAAQR